MSKEQSSRKYIEIPGEKMVINNFHFDMTLPSPAPHPKTLYLPLDSDRYIKPKTTLFHVKRKAAIMTDMDLSISAEDVNMHPEKYNQTSNTAPVMPNDIKELIDEIVPRPVKIAAPVLQKKQSNGDNLGLVRATSASKAESQKVEVKTDSIDKKKEEKLSLEEIVGRSFENIKNVKVGMKHPKKGDRVTCEQVCDVLPNLKEIISEFYILKSGAASSMLKEKLNIMKFETDVDTKPVLAVSLEKPLFENVSDAGNAKNSAEESNFENVHNFEHFGNYLYSIFKKGEANKKEFVFDIKKKESKAYLYQPNSILFKKKNVIYNTNAPRDDEDEASAAAKEKKNIRVLKNDYIKEETVLRKKKYEEMRLNNIAEYKDIQKKLENVEDEDDKLEIMKKRIIQVEEIKRQNSKEKDEEKNKEDEEQPVKEKKNKLKRKIDIENEERENDENEAKDEKDNEEENKKDEEVKEPEENDKNLNDELDDVFGDDE